MLYQNRLISVIYTVKVCLVLGWYIGLVMQSVYIYQIEDIGYAKKNISVKQKEQIASLL